MENEQLLRNVGFNKYESVAYLTILKDGFTDAATLSNRSRIPMGKIYSVLDYLETMGFVEVQHSRPKKYRAIEANIAFEQFFEKKETEMQRELRTLRKTIDDIINKLSQYHAQDETDQHFWSAAMGNAEVMKMIKSVYNEAKNEICIVVPRNIRSMEFDQFKNMFASMFHDTLLPLMKKGIKIRMIDPNPALIRVLREWHISSEDETVMQKVFENLEIKSLDTPHRFLLIDKNLVILEVADPISLDNIFGMVKIYDPVLSAQLHEQFEDSWQKAKIQYFR
ncbi:MAG: helix-turn-helix domain-containing protein [Methanolobus sp.]|nr:helix-turn-helix domain-containing protein [Methanolobus sp.]